MKMKTPQLIAAALVGALALIGATAAHAADKKPSTARIRLE